jgi:CheY-like chemotaxis protein
VSDSAAAEPLRDDGAGDRSQADARWRLSSVPGLPGAAAQPRSRRVGRVLIVDDNRDAREMYGLYFRMLGYDVTMAEDGPRGIDMALQLKPDVIVMDLAMPGMSGVGAAEYLKRDPRTQSIPVILLTGHGARAIEERALERGVDVFLTKPCLPEDLEGYVRRLLDSRRGG